MAETGAALAIKPMPQSTLDVEEPEAPEEAAPRDSWFESGTPAPGRRSAWKDVLKVGMK